MTNEAKLLSETCVQNTNPEDTEAAEKKTDIHARTLVISSLRLECPQWLILFQAAAAGIESRLEWCANPSAARLVRLVLRERGDRGRKLVDDGRLDQMLFNCGPKQVCDGFPGGLIRIIGNMGVSAVEALQQPLDRIVRT